jgi:hypothetical protein
VEKPHATEAQWLEIMDLSEEVDKKASSTSLRLSTLRRVNVLLGLPIAVLGGVISASAFSTLGEGFGPRWQLVTAILSLTITAFASIQIFFRFPDEIRKAQVRLAQYEDLRDEIEPISKQMLIALKHDTPTDARGKFGLSESEARSLISTTRDTLKQIRRQELGVEMMETRERG